MPDVDLLRLVFGLIVDLFRSRAALEAEILVLRQQIIVLRRSKLTRPPFMAADRLVLGWVCRLFPSACDALAIIRPQTVMRWHRAGFRSYWRWKSRRRSGRTRRVSRDPPVDPRGEHCQSVVGSAADSRRAAQARHRRWANQRRQVHGAEEGSSVTGAEDLPSHHADGIAAMDLFVVPTISFRLLYGLLILRHDRRRILWLGVTMHPTAEWIARQLVEALGWDRAPRYLMRDRDRSYGQVLLRRVRAMGIRDRPTSPRSPWQNGYAERLIGSIRRECVDHVVVLGERHLRHLLRSTCSTTMRRARTYPWARMRRSHALSRPSVTYSAAPCWADCITNTCGSNLRQAHAHADLVLIIDSKRSHQPASPPNRRAPIPHLS